MQQISCVTGELLTHAERKHYKSLTALMLGDYAAKFEFLHGLAESEPLEQSAPAASDRPLNGELLMRFECRVNLVERYLEPALFGDFYLVI